MELSFHAGLTLEKFWLEWWGLHGRELGSNLTHSFGTHPKGYKESHRMFTNQPQFYLQFIDWCKTNKAACWITSQPMREYGVPLGIEKIFFDFDYHLEKNENMTPAKREKVKELVLKFTETLDYEPLLVSTRKGYHVYIFLRRIYEFEPRNLEFASEVFGVIGLSLLGMRKLYEQLEEHERKRWKYLDFSPLGDIMRMARVPLTPHEDTGIPCYILNRDLEPTKVRSLDLYKAYGLREDKIREAVEIVKEYHKRKIKEQWKQIRSGVQVFEGGNGFTGQMRPCFTERLFKLGEMNHQQRLALLMEAWASGYKTEEQLMRLCTHFKDYNETISRMQIKWFLKNKAGKFPPYQCETLQQHGYCLKDECPIYRKRHLSKT